MSPRSKARRRPGPGQRRVSPHLALILLAPVLAGLVIAVPVLAIVTMGATLIGTAMPALASAPAVGRVPSAVLCTGYRGCPRHGHPTYGYGRRRHRSFWRMSAGNECTNYVAYVESRHFGVRTPRYRLGNAGQWPRSAGRHGVRINRRPSVGAVAEWGPRAYGIGRLGHVAVVQKVGPRDRYIVISQQHISREANGYDWTRINAGWSRHSWQSWPTHFIHFRIRRHR